MENDIHASSNHFCFRSDEIGHLSQQCLVDRLTVMIWNERNIYNYHRFFPHEHARGQQPGHQGDEPRVVNAEWRASICKWSYNVADYFDLSREVVAISMSLFDRYLATRNNRYTSNLVLLASIATLHIAIKVRESAIIRLETLSSFSRNNFSPRQISRMELSVLTSLSWLANPPTVPSFVAHLLLLIPPGEIDTIERKDLYSSTRFLAELSVADSYFVDRTLPSVVGLACIMNYLDECVTLSPAAKSRYLQFIADEVGIQHDDDDIAFARDRLNLLLISNENDA